MFRRLRLVVISLMFITGYVMLDRSFIVEAKSDIMPLSVWTETDNGFTYYDGDKYPVGWVNYQNYWYYMYKAGDVNRMAVSEWINGQYIDRYGHKTDINGFFWVDTEEGKSYQNKGGRCVVGAAIIDGHSYRFDEWGCLPIDRPDDRKVVVSNEVKVCEGSVVYTDRDGVEREVALSYDEPYDITDNHTSKGYNAPFVDISNLTGQSSWRTESYYSNYEKGQYACVQGKDYRTAYYSGEGLFHVAKDGTIRDEDGYIVVATKRYKNDKLKVVMTSLGPGKVYDASGGSLVDIYTNWH